METLFRFMSGVPARRGSPRLLIIKGIRGRHYGNSAHLSVVAWQSCLARKHQLFLKNLELTSGKLTEETPLQYLVFTNMSVPDTVLHNTTAEVVRLKNAIDERRSDGPVLRPSQGQGFLLTIVYTAINAGLAVRYVSVLEKPSWSRDSRPIRN